MKKLSFTNFNIGIIVFSEIKNAVVCIDWKKKIWAIKSDSITFPTDKERKRLIRKYKIDMSGLTTYSLKEEKK